ncbi:MAG: response regulator transcription factor [Lachnospiraceae bacterium]|nr:response regulator transcription factor [Lachnospiraceae bacterium]
MAKILIVDDEKLIVKGLRFSLEQEGYQVDCAYDGEEAVRMAGSTDYDLMLLDLMLPRISGLEVCQQVREFSDVPIIMVTAKGEDMDKIMGLEYGADDYVTKPFNILEVKARIKAILRRTASRGSTVREAEKPDVVVSGDLKLYREDRRFEIEDREIKLTSKEFELLDLLMTHPGKVYGREKLLQLVWGADFPGDERTVDVHIRRLREKIEPNPSEPIYVQTKWGVGYYYKEHAAKA